MQPDVDEGRLHAGQDPQHPTFIYVPGDVGIIPAVHVNLDDGAIFEQGDAGLVFSHIDDELLVHRTTLTYGFTGHAASRFRPFQLADPGVAEIGFRDSKNLFEDLGRPHRLTRLAAQGDLDRHGIRLAYIHQNIL